MFAIIAIGLLTIALSAVMIARPHAFGRAIKGFAEKSYFHVAEIAIRLVLGAALVYFATSTRSPGVVSAVGYLFLFAGVFLIVAGRARHHAFAAKSATFVGIFRPAGVFSLAFGGFLVWSALSPSS